MKKVVDFNEKFQELVSGPLSYEEIYERSLAFIEDHDISKATIHIMLIAKTRMGYGVWVSGYSGWWIFKKKHHFSTLFGVRLNDNQMNVLGYNADIETKTSYERNPSWYKPSQVNVRTTIIRGVGMKTPDGKVVNAKKSIALENGDPAVLPHI